MGYQIVIKFSLRSHVEFEQESGFFVAHSPRVGISSQGTSVQDAQESLTDALGLYLRRYAARGFQELLKMLGGHGFVPLQGLVSVGGIDLVEIRVIDQAESVDEPLGQMVEVDLPLPDRQAA